jgi:predicted metal-dependent peptidase
VTAANQREREALSHEAREKMARARSELVLDHPFFAHLALRLTLREDPSCASAWTDGRTLAYNPGYVRGLPSAKVKGMQCHEVLHLACAHHVRRAGRDKALWNRACDLAINPLLLEAGLELPSGYLHDPDFEGRSAEAIYAALLEVDRERRESFSGKQGPGEPDDAEGEARAAEGGESAEPESPSDEISENPPDAEGRAPGSGADGGETAEDEAGADPGMSGEVRDAPADHGGQDTETDLALEEQSWKEALARAAHRQREAGELPAGLARLVGACGSRALPWRELLRRFVERAVKNDYSWIRPDRRHIHAGLHLPGLDGREPALLAVGLDTSGSIDERDLARFGAELSALVEELDAQVLLLACDAALHSETLLTRADLPLALSPGGGGGTDYRPVFQRLEHGPAPTCLVYLTDLNCDRFPPEPAYPVLWACTEPGFAPPPFGEVVAMERH